MTNQTLILGGGMTGLAAGLASGFPVYEAAASPGGICSSYYVRPGSQDIYRTLSADGEAYHFEIGGGHWIFGGDPAILHFINSLTPTRAYSRRSAVYFAAEQLYVPYPLQNHLGFLGRDLAAKSLTEIVNTPAGRPVTMADWLQQSFGSTLTEKFFAPFHELYTAGLWTRIAPQDAYKSPVNLAQAVEGAFGETTAGVGYNVTFVYPEAGLNSLAQKMASRCDVRYNRRAVNIDLADRIVIFADGSTQRFSSLLSTLPLNQMITMTGLSVDEPADPYTSVLVLNIGAVKGSRCPDYHWLYNPDARSGFHRVGFYSNVDPLFLPVSAQENGDRVSIYVERAYPGGQKPSSEEIRIYTNAVLQELQDWRFIAQPEVVDPTWIDVAYTWSWPASHWRTKALKKLEEHGIFQVGRYGRWLFQGIADSIRDGFFVGAAIKQGVSIE